MKQKGLFQLPPEKTFYGHNKLEYLSSASLYGLV
jgi:hypothetical protein